MFTKEFLTALAERAIKTTAWVLGATLLSAGTGLIDTDWVGVLSTTGMATLLSVLGNIATGKFTDSPGPAAFGPEKVEVTEEIGNA